MAAPSIPTRPLNDGQSLPAIGLGTFGMRGPSGVASVVSGLEAGYRLLDTALRYRNEKEVGEGVRESGVDRGDISVTTKLRGRNHGFYETLEGFDESLASLGLDYVDLYLIHWPLPRLDKFVDSWRAMIWLRDQGAIRSIGVSNFTPAHIGRLLVETGVTPAVNQVELHPYFPQAAQRAFHAEYGIVTESWSPLGRKRRRLASEPIIVSIAAAHAVTTTQVVLRWHLQLGAVAIPKSANPARQAANLDILGFELTDSEVEAISSLESRRTWWADPDRHYEL
ncbi:MAG: aldo/keto reductase [Microbacteriaceae bacterium]|nr:aldo/keto reductase [Microbacteriaceae bacterium]